MEKAQVKREVLDPDFVEPETFHLRRKLWLEKNKNWEISNFCGPSHGLWSDSSNRGILNAKFWHDFAPVRDIYKTIAPSPHYLSLWAAVRRRLSLNSPPLTASHKSATLVPIVPPPSKSIADEQIKAFGDNALFKPQKHQLLKLMVPRQVSHKNLLLVQVLCPCWLNQKLSTWSIKSVPGDSGVRSILKTASLRESARTCILANKKEELGLSIYKD